MSDNVILIVDSSASTEFYYKQYTDAVHRIVQTHAQAQPDASLTLVTFDTQPKYIHINQRISSLNGTFRFQPSGTTALYDCLCTIINKMSHFTEITHRSPATVVILTDGEDTASRRMNPRLTAIQIAMAKNQGWKFVFLGTSLHALEIGKQIGCNSCVLYSTTKKSLDNVSQVISDMLSKPVQDIDIDIRDLETVMSGMSMQE